MTRLFPVEVAVKGPCSEYGAGAKIPRLYLTFGVLSRDRLSGDDLVEHPTNRRATEISALDLVPAQNPKRQGSLVIFAPAPYSDGPLCDFHRKQLNIIIQK